MGYLRRSAPANGYRTSITPPARGPQSLLRHAKRVGILVASTICMLRTITTSFDLWSTEQILLVYQRYYGKLDAQARRRIVETARLNGWDRTWRGGVEFLAA